MTSNFPPAHLRNHQIGWGPTELHVNGPEEIMWFFTGGQGGQGRAILLTKDGRGHATALNRKLMCFFSGPLVKFTVPLPVSFSPPQARFLKNFQNYCPIPETRPQNSTRLAPLRWQGSIELHWSSHSLIAITWKQGRHWAADLNRKLEAPGFGQADVACCQALLTEESQVMYLGHRAWSLGSRF